MEEEGKRGRLSHTPYRSAVVKKSTWASLSETRSWSRRDRPTCFRSGCDAFLRSALLTVFGSKCRFATQAFGTTRFDLVLAGRRMAAGWPPNGCRWVPVRTCRPPVRYRLGRSRPAGRARSLTSQPFPIRQPLHIRQAQEQRRAVGVLALVEKLVNALVAATAAVHEHVFQFHEPPKLTRSARSLQPNASRT